MSALSIITSWKKNIFKPIYWLEGDEEFFIDEVMDYAEKKILPEAEASFNLTVFYGKDANWADIINACRRYPMFAERQVIVLKEAQQMKDIDKLEPYMENPLASTVLVVSYKGKTLDGRSKLSKLVKKNGEIFLSKKIYENQLPAWTNGYLQSKGFQITPRALTLLVDHVGNDLSRIANEIDKLSVNVSTEKSITEDDIEKYVGISKEFNVYELQNAIAQRNMYKALRIVQYFESNPKAGPLQLIFPSLYNFFSKVQAVLSVGSRDEKVVAAEVGISAWFVKDYLQTAARYDTAGIEKILLLLHVYNLKSIGINDAGTEDMELLKELIVKIIQH